MTALPAIHKQAGQRGRTGNGKLLAPLARPDLADAVVFVDSMVLPAAVTEHPARLADNHPRVVKGLGDAANAGFMRLWADRRPFRMLGANLTPLAYPRDAHVRHEGGALYPLEIAAGGFGDRVSSDGAWRQPLSGTEALRFRARGPRARFAIHLGPTRGRDGGAGGLRAAPSAPRVDVRLDGRHRRAAGTRAEAARVASFDLPGAGEPGPALVEMKLSEGGTLFMDYVELR